MSVKHPWSAVAYDDRVSVNIGAGPLVAATQHLGHTAYGPVANAAGIRLRESTAFVGEQIKLEKPPAQIVALWQRHHLPAMTKAAGRLLGELRTLNEKYRKERDDWLKPPALPSDVRAAMIFNALTGRKASELFKLAVEDGEAAHVILKHYDLLNLPAAARPQIEESIIRANMQRSFERSSGQPTMADPLGELPNPAAGELTEKTLGALETLRADITSGVKFVGAVVDHASALSDTPRPAVFRAFAQAA